MKGKVLTEAIDINFLEINPLRYIDTYEITQNPVYKERRPHIIDEQELEKMRSLGYVH